MGRYRQSRRSQRFTTTTSDVATTFDDTDMQPGDNEKEENSSTHGESQTIVIDTNIEENQTIDIDAPDEEKNLKSNVWYYAKKLSSDEAQCKICKLYVKTINGGTTTLRKHLINKHHLIHLACPAASRPTTSNTITHEQKARLDHLANLAILVDGRSFGDLRKTGIRKFLSEAIPGNYIVRLKIFRLKYKSIFTFDYRYLPPTRFIF
ncbi:unnamed protein product [Rotaria sp. Silwood2]|nr:unnamed protein product [Rotaria sp. Silwood2]CAF4594747.1 unnamed protein product [Rotaria sp. Silwood2]